MAQQRILPSRLTFPKADAGWASSITNFLSDVLYRILSDRVEALITQDTLANRPAANGSRRFFFATDTNTLYYDTGSWVAVPTALDQQWISATFTAATPLESGFFDVTVAGATVGKTVPVMVVAPIGTAEADQQEWDPIEISGFCTSATNIRCYWRAPEGPIIGTRSVLLQQAA